MRTGVIYLVATPIGNLEDITLRALRVLREADLIACEDTRHSSRLLRHFKIETPLVSCHEHNEARRAAELAARALAGEAIAVISDAGTPSISDPGFRVVRAALDAGVRVVPVPGPNAVVTALSASGLPGQEFAFAGFLPPKKTKRRAALRHIEIFESTVVLFEAPHRILDSLIDLHDVLGDRSIVVARELTKVHEEFLHGSALSIRRVLARRPAVKGEFVILLAPRSKAAVVADVPLSTRVAQLEREGNARMDAIKQAARERGVTKREAYALFHAELQSDS